MEKDISSVKYAVLKLSTDISFPDPWTNKEIVTKLGGCAGYIPVFDTIEEANRSSEHGKYQVLPINILT